MKRFGTLLAFCGAVLVTIAAAQGVAAQTTLSDDHLERIRQNCVAAQSTLDRIHVNDALNRNYGSRYEQISLRLMARFNSLVALDRLDGLELSAITLRYDDQFRTFRASYIEYERSMARTLQINCVNQPAEFHASVQVARELRQKLHQDVVTLTDLLKEYKAEFEDFAREIEGSS